jgi:hypothetical protein
MLPPALIHTCAVQHPHCPSRISGKQLRLGSSNLRSAARQALARCGTDDASVVARARNGWYCALGVGADGSDGSGSGPTAAKARAVALGNCRKYTKDCTIAVCV